MDEQVKLCFCCSVSVLKVCQLLFLSPLAKLWSEMSATRDFNVSRPVSAESGHPPPAVATDRQTRRTRREYRRTLGERLRLVAERRVNRDLKKVFTARGRMMYGAVLRGALTDRCLKNKPDPK